MTDIPRVSDILKPYLPDFERWDPQRKGADKGTAVDAGCRLLFQGYKVDDLIIDGQIMGYLESLELWLRHTGFKALRIQPEYVSARLGVKGHPDVVSIDEVWDTKIGNKVKGYRMQTAGYKILANENDDDVNIQKRGCLYLQEDGSMAVQDPHNDRSDEGAFLSALKLYHGEQSLQVYRDNLARWKESA